MNLWERHKRRRRRRILDATRQLVRAGGAETLSIREIARAAALSVPTLYQLLGPKDAILAAVLEDGLAGLEEQLAALRPHDPLERAVAIPVAAAERLSAEPDLYAPLLAALGPTLGGPPLPAFARAQVVLVGDAIEAAAARRSLSRDTPAALLASQILLLTSELLGLWARGALGEAELRDRVECGARSMLLGWAGTAARTRLRGQVTRRARRLGRRRGGGLDGKLLAPAPKPATPGATRGSGPARSPASAARP